MKKILFIQAILQLFIQIAIAQNAGYQQEGPEGAMPPGDKKVFWVHGLAGSQEGWNAIAPWYANTYKMRSYRPEYEEVNGMPVAVNELNQKLEDLTANDPAADVSKYIAIGHSQGGLIVRGIDKRANSNSENMRFGAFITMSTPNGGAPIVNSFNDNKHTYFLRSFISGLAAGPLADNIIARVFNSIFNNSGQLEEKLAVTLGKVIGTSFIRNTTDDFYMGANWVNTLNTWAPQSNTPRVHIVGVETDPVHWRLLSTYVLKDAADFRFNETGDELMIEKMNSLYTDYLNNQNHNERMSRTFIRNGVRSFVSDLPFVKLPKYSELAAKYKRGADAILGFGDGWNTIIGAYTAGWQTTSWSFTPRQCCLQSNCNPNHCREGNVTCGSYCSGTFREYVVTKLDSDGVVPVPQQELPGGSYKRYVAMGANHGEMRNHPEANAKLKLIFDGDVTGVNAERFQVEKRPQ